MSAMVRLNLIVEGVAEETFVRDVLRGVLADKQVITSVRMVKTGRVHGVDYRGGMTTYEKAKADIERWIREDRSAYFGTMFDFYALPGGFPGKKTLPHWIAPLEKVRILEKALADDIDNRRFIPYIQLHEFEGLLFSDVQIIDEVLSVSHSSKLAALNKIRNDFATPEDINDGQHTAPSKRLIDLYGSYEKLPFGVQIAQKIGLERIRQECPHFNEWLTRIESLASPSRSRANE